MKSSLRAAFLMGGEEAGGGKQAAEKERRMIPCRGKFQREIFAGQRQGGILSVNRFLTCFSDLRGKGRESFSEAQQVPYNEFLRRFSRWERLQIFSGKIKTGLTGKRVWIIIISIQTEPLKSDERDKRSAYPSSESRCKVRTGRWQQTYYPSQAPVSN